MNRLHLLTRRGFKVALGAWLAGLSLTVTLEAGAGERSYLAYGGAMAGMLMGIGVGALISGRWRDD